MGEEGSKLLVSDLSTSQREGSCSSKARVGVRATQGGLCVGGDVAQGGKLQGQVLLGAGTVGRVKCQGGRGVGRGPGGRWEECRHGAYRHWKGVGCGAGS